MNYFITWMLSTTLKVLIEYKHTKYVIKPKVNTISNIVNGLP